jgi:hypothetical protein
MTSTSEKNASRLAQFIAHTGKGRLIAIAIAVLAAAVATHHRFEGELSL